MEEDLINKRIQTRQEIAAELAREKLEDADIAANRLLEVAAEQARVLITEATVRARDLLALAVTQAQELIKREQIEARKLIETAAEEDRIDALALQERAVGVEK